MPQYQARHARLKKSEYEQPGSRHIGLLQAVNDDPDPAKKTPRKKDPATCKGNNWGPHTQVIALCHPSPQDQLKSKCRYIVVWNQDKKKLTDGWHCDHQLVCGTCGKVFKVVLTSADCPSYPGDEDQRADIIQQAEARNEELRTSPRWNKSQPVIDGPQGFRRQKAGKNDE
jgi:hypothetical protein